MVRTQYGELGIDTNVKYVKTAVKPTAFFVTLCHECRSAVVGWFETCVEAVEALNKNPEEMTDRGYYTKAIIEEVRSGFHPISSQIVVYKFDYEKNLWIIDPNDNALNSSRELLYCGIR